MTEFSTESLIAAFGEMAKILDRERQRGRIYIAGGAAMLLAHDSEKTTRDVDASIDESHGAVTRAAREVAHRHGWATSWLNEQATSYFPPEASRRGSVVFDHPALKVVAASAEHMLAMKARAARATDKTDVEQLIAACGFESADEVDALATDVFGEGLGERQRMWIAGILSESTASGTPVT